MDEIPEWNPRDLLFSESYQGLEEHIDKVYELQRALNTLDSDLTAEQSAELSIVGTLEQRRLAPGGLVDDQPILIAEEMEEVYNNLRRSTIPPRSLPAVGPSTVDSSELDHMTFYWWTTLTTLHQRVRSCSTDIPRCPEVTTYHRDSAYHPDRMHTVENLDSRTDSPRFTTSQSFEPFRRDAFGDQEESVEILPEAHSKSEGLFEGFIEGLPDDEREVFSDVRDPSNRWRAPFNLPPSFASERAPPIV